MRFFCALLIAAAVHLALGALLVLYFERNAGPDEPARMDVSSVELSLAENENDAAMPVVSAPPVEVPPSPPAENSESPAIDETETLIVEEPPVIAQIEIPSADIPAPPRMDVSKVPNPTVKDKRTAGKSEERESRVSDKREPVAAASAPVQARVDVAPKLHRPIKPEYPRASRERGEAGAVRLRIGIGAKGLVESAEIIASTGFKLLDEAALKAVRAARFIPARLDGEAVFSTAEIKLEFKLR